MLNSFHKEAVEAIKAAGDAVTFQVQGENWINKSFPIEVPPIYRYNRYVMILTGSSYNDHTGRLSAFSYISNWTIFYCYFEFSLDQNFRRL